MLPRPDNLDKRSFVEQFPDERRQNGIGTLFDRRFDGMGVRSVGASVCIGALCKAALYSSIFIREVYVSHSREKCRSVLGVCRG